MKYCLDLLFITAERIVTVKMADNLHSPSFNCGEKLNNKKKYFSNSSYSRKKNNSFSSLQTPEKSHNNAVNYYSDNASSYVQSSVKKAKQRRSLSSSPTLYSHYAGAKFSEPPSPSVLPLPPTHWTELTAAMDTVTNASTTPRSVTPVDFEITDSSCTSTPVSAFSQVSTPTTDVNQSVELFFQRCSFTQLETCKDFTQQLKTLLNVPA